MILHLLVVPRFTYANFDTKGDTSTDNLTDLAALAADADTGKPFVQALWNTQTPRGQWRYYDGMLYFLALLHVSGHFQIYYPKPA